MVEFADTRRTKCRNPKCRMKLPAPTDNPRDAFCTRGCHNSFYLRRCLVCEGEMVRKRGNQRVCGKRKCRNALATRSAHSRYLTSSSPILIQVKPAKWALESSSRTTEMAFRDLVAVARRQELHYWYDESWPEVVSPDGVRCFVMPRKDATYQHTRRAA